MSNFGAQDPFVLQAIREIEGTYGDVVSVIDKRKSLNKFGINDSVGTSPETVAEFQGSVANEAFVSTNIIDSISSSSASDTTQTITVEGHTIDGSGNLTFVSQDAELNGQNKVTLTTPLARANRLFVKNSGTFNTTPATLAGTVYVYDDTDGVSSGVPTTAAATKVLILAGRTQSRKCATSISSSDYWIVTGIEAAVSDAANSTNSVTFNLEVRDVANGGVWRPLGRELIAVPAAFNPEPARPMPYRIVPKNHDVRVVAFTDASTAPVFAEISGYLALIVT